MTSKMNKPFFTWSLSVHDILKTGGFSYSGYLTSDRLASIIAVPLGWMHNIKGYLGEKKNVA